MVISCYVEPILREMWEITRGYHQYISHWTTTINTATLRPHAVWDSKAYSLFLSCRFLQGTVQFPNVPCSIISFSNTHTVLPCLASDETHRYCYAVFTFMPCFILSSFVPPLVMNTWSKRLVLSSFYPQSLIGTYYMFLGLIVESKETDLKLYLSAICRHAVSNLKHHSLGDTRGYKKEW